MDLNIFDDDFLYDGFQKFGVGGMISAIPHYSSLQYKKNLAIAMMASRGGFSSLDYVKKRFGNTLKINEIELSEPHQIIFEINKYVKQYVNTLSQRIDQIPDKTYPDTFGYLVASVALRRLRTSFKLARFSLFEGFRIESMCIIKLILEQCTWAYSVYNLTNEKVNTIQPSKSINNFKSVYPNIGKIYGEINEVSHLSTSRIRELVDIKDEEIWIKLTSPKDTLHTSLILLLATDIYCITSEIIFKKLLPTVDFINSQNNLPNRNRAFLTDFILFKKRVENLWSDK
ncbi:MAG: hypothetical protein CMB80_18715 [Flammeovirgaceae bacterium]|nr:hypothetical protein [Flammeovirgaceae bacterium]HCX20628.1 hypothetical protein [Cytophagales bacterium]